MTLEEIGKCAKEAARRLALCTTDEKNRALCMSAQALLDETPYILAENEKDIVTAKANGMSDSLLDRLRLTDARIAGMAKGLRDVAELPDPVGRVLAEDVRPNGLRLTKVAVPIGVIAVIYEARPNVTADGAAMCLPRGNAVMLRGGTEAIRSNVAVANVMNRALAAAGLPIGCMQLVESTDRAVTQELMKLNRYVDLLIPRGGAGLIRAVVENATVPVIETGAGTCHVYVDRAADIDMAVRIIDNAKTSRPSVCNAAECMLIHRDIAAAALPRIAARLREKGVEIHAAPDVLALVPQALPATDEDWGKEYGDYIIAARIVDSEDEAINYITR